MKEYDNKVICHGKHEDIKEIINELGIDKVDGILLDLGVSSYQLDDKSRGFSYMADSKLDMRMNTEDTLSAYDIINNYSEEELVRIFFQYGEENYSRKIAKKICEVRSNEPIETTLELVNIIKSAIPFKATLEKQHPAKRVFQAIRISVNGELKDLKQTIIDSVNSLNTGGRLLIITFHSLEDRIVKQTFNELEGSCICPKDFPVCICQVKKYGKNLTKKPIIPSINEVKGNPRSRSAKLRIFEKN